MLRAICLFGMTLASITLPPAQAQHSGISNLYVAAGVGPPRLVGKYSTRAKCLQAASVAGRDVIALNAPSDQPQSVAVLFCVPGGS
jgi:hypothetical protein